MVPGLIVTSGGAAWDGAAARSGVAIASRAVVVVISLRIWSLPVSCRLPECGQPDRTSSLSRMILRLSSLFVRTLREDPADAEVPSHRLLLRAGYIRRAAPGIYTWLPLGLRVLRRIENIIRDEMDAMGAPVDRSAGHLGSAQPAQGAQGQSAPGSRARGWGGSR